ncbi:MAG: hypothetical protein NPIRA05_08550 [Nitrospirales bacterium]|nr:MAG: hypothetical protein NPIRA05_08550 [Nitrospirales bacterium]
MLFFQVMLLSGYAYSHMLTNRFSLQCQSGLHMMMLLLSLLILPIVPSETLALTAEQDPIRQIVFLLLLSVGIPFLLLATTGPLLQRWISLHRSGTNPYRMYALSNIGSLLALLSYPFFVEPFVDLAEQTVAWSAGYVLFVISTGWCAMTVYRTSPVHLLSIDTQERNCSQRSSAVCEDLPLPRTRCLWLALSTCGSLMLLATTNHMTMDIAPVPFLWILPLSLYLLSFIMCFHGEQSYNRRIWSLTFFVYMTAAFVILFEGVSVNIGIQIFVFSFTLLTCSMICHGELARLKPNPEHLTSFYIIIASGGALGGIIVNVVAPTVFDTYWEYPLGLLMTYALFVVCVLLEQSNRPAGSWSRKQWVALLAGGVIVCVTFGLYVRQEQDGLIASSRNFYGVLRVYEYGAGTDDWERYLYHGQLMHGRQWLAEERQGYPTGYFGRRSGTGVAALYHPNRLAGGMALEKGAGLHIGVVGLGVGTVAAYGQSGDTIRFYEINPDVPRVAKEYFSYLQDIPARVDTVLGDARISMERELAQGGSQRFDMLLLDAFNSDAVPMHLMTKEAFALYWQHLKPDGILVVHISAVHVDLNPVVRGLATLFNKHAIRMTNTRERRAGVNWSESVLVTSNQEFLDNPEVQSRTNPRRGSKPETVIWTDDFSNVLEVIK